MIDRPAFAMGSAAHRRTPSSGQRRDGERSESGRVRAADERAVLNRRAHTRTSCILAFVGIVLVLVGLTLT